MGWRILVVEDDQDLIDSLRVVLEDEGHEVVTASDGSEVLAAVDAEDAPLPHLVLVDLNLGGSDLSGAPLLRALRERLGCRAPIVLLSGETGLGAHATQLGADGFLEKPFAIDKLLELIEALRAASEEQHAPR